MTWSTCREQVPAHIIKVNLWVVSEPTLVWATTIVMLDTIGIEALNLPIVLCDDQLYKHLPLWSKKEPLKLFGVFKLCKSL